MHLRSLKRVRGEVSLYDPIGVDREGNEITLVDVRKRTPPARHSARRGPVR
jgi:RNA polymerase sporulation-specific sigma factor